MAENPVREKLSRFEQEAAKIYNIDSDFCILNIYRLGSIAGEAGKRGAIMMKSQDGHPKLLQEFSKLCKDFEEELGDTRVEIYIPFEGSKTERESVSRTKSDEILNLLNSFHER